MSNMRSHQRFCGCVDVYAGETIPASLFSMTLAQLPAASL